MLSLLCLAQHKPGRIKPGRIQRAALSLQNQNGCTFDVCRVKYPGTKQLPIHISGAGFAPNSQIWLLGTTPFDTTPFILLRYVGKRPRREGLKKCEGGHMLPGAPPSPCQPRAQDRWQRTREQTGTSTPNPPTNIIPTDTASQFFR